MKKMLSVMILLAGFVVFGDGELPTLFDKALIAEGKDYSDLRAQILASDPVPLKEFLNEKVADPKSSVLERSLALALIEHIDKKAAIEKLYYIGRLKEDDPHQQAQSYTPTRYPQKWCAPRKEDFTLIIAEYKKDECPYFILESIWKYHPHGGRRGGRSFQDVKGFTIPGFIFYGIAKELKPELKEAFTAAIKDRLSKNISDQTEIEAAEYLLYMGAENSCQVVLDWAAARMREDPDNRGGGDVYNVLCILLPGMQGADIKVLKAAKKVLDGDKSRDVQNEADAKKLLDSLIKFYEKGVPPDDEWIFSYLDRANCERLSIDLIKPFLLKLRPDMDNRIKEKMIIYEKDKNIKF